MSKWRKFLETVATHRTISGFFQPFNFFQKNYTLSSFRRYLYVYICRLTHLKLNCILAKISQSPSMHQGAWKIFGFTFLNKLYFSIIWACTFQVMYLHLDFNIKNPQKWENISNVKVSLKSKVAQSSAWNLVRWQMNAKFIMSNQFYLDISWYEWIMRIFWVNSWVNS